MPVGEDQELDQCLGLTQAPGVGSDRTAVHGGFEPPEEPMLTPVSSAMVSICLLELSAREAASLAPRYRSTVPPDCSAQPGIPA